MISKREEWLFVLNDFLKSDFNRKGFPLPANIRISCEWPPTKGVSESFRIPGMCISHECSFDGKTHIYISPKLNNTLDVCSVLIHELSHAVSGLECGHRGAFRRCALAVGLTGRMVSTVASKELAYHLKEIIHQIGEYPHAEDDIFIKKLSIDNENSIMNLETTFYK